MGIGTEYNVGYAYDSVGRFSTLTNGTDTFTYGYLANSDLVSSIAYPNNISVTKSYESQRDLISSVENKYGTTTVSKYIYTNDAIGRRSNMGKEGTAFSQTDVIAYGYNARSEVTSAAATNETLYNYAYSFDNIGNRITASERGTSLAYTSNSLNQYTLINTTAPTYDVDGDMLTNGSGWTYTWDAENRLASATNGTQILTFKYDYMSRRVEKTVSISGSNVIQERFVYDNYLQIEKLNALDSNAILRKRIWGSEEKIIADVNASGTSFYALGDANKNITEYLDASGTIQGHYEYSPFGKITVATGVAPDAFDFRFSSEYYDSETGLVYYNFRYYSPDMGKWLAKDPIGEKGGWNLYGMLNNDSINNTDFLGYSDKVQNSTAIKEASFPETLEDAYNSSVDLTIESGKDGIDAEREYCGLICKCDGKNKYVKTGPIQGDAPVYKTVKREVFKKSRSGTYIYQGMEEVRVIDHWSCQPSKAPCPSGTTAVESYHTHTKSASNKPSDRDFEIANMTDPKTKQPISKPDWLFPTNKGKTGEGRHITFGTGTDNMPPLQKVVK